MRFHPIQRTVLHFFLYLFLALSVVSNVLMSRILVDSFLGIEEKEAEQNVGRARAQIDRELDKLASISQDWGVWDDTYWFMAGSNPEYPEGNLDPDTLRNLDLDLLLLADVDGRVRTAASVGADGTRTETLPEGFSAQLSAICSRTGDAPQDRRGSILRLPDGLMLIASCPILQNNGVGPRLGTLVVGIRLDAARIGRIARDVALELSVEAPTGAGASTDSIQADPSSPAAEASAGDGAPLATIERSSSSLLTASTTLTGLDGLPAGVLRVRMVRTSFEAGMRSIRYTFFVMFASGLAVGFILLRFLRDRVLNRISGLSREVLHISETAMPSLRVGPQTYNDEIHLLAAEINRMLARLDDAERKLVKANMELEAQVLARTQELADRNARLQREIEERVHAQEQITELAYHDVLTGLPNRRLFNDRLAQAIHLARRLERPLGVMFIDLDAFKNVNDTMGHHMGDELLRLVADRVRAVVRREDTLCRTGGDEFLLALQNVENPEDVTRIADKILDSCRQPFRLGSQEFYLTASIGVAVYPIDGEDAETLVKNADIALYRAKELGRDQQVLCTPVMKETVLERMALTNCLYRALSNEELEVWYQPQVRCGGGRLAGAEALLRWRHPMLGLVSPTKFIPLAEQTGLIQPIGEWVLRTACAQQAAWAESGAGSLRMAVNVSLNQLMNLRFPERLEEILREVGMDPRLLEVEITESIAMSESGAVYDMLEHVRRAGISIAIDDFGTEYSSLARLKELPANRLKIAMPFVQGIGVNEKDEAIVKAVIVLATSLGMHTIAEGVETDGQLAFLEARGCEEVQGYLYYRPMPADEMERVLRSEEVRGKEFLDSGAAGGETANRKPAGREGTEEAPD